MSSSGTSRQELSTTSDTMILDACVRMLDSPGADFSMSRLAVEAGISRATLYRAFPDRRAVLAATSALALREAQAALRDADVVDVDDLGEAILAIVTALIGVADRYYLAYDHGLVDADDHEQLVGSVLRAVLERFRGDRVRADHDIDFQVRCLESLVNVGCRQHVYEGISVGIAAAWVTETFIGGVTSLVRIRR